MSDTVIKVSGLSKKYIISHETSERYTALRDVIQRKTNKLFSRKKNKQSIKEEFWALNDINFEVKQGDAIGIIGRNGAGKSTLLKILSRITEPTKGRVEIHKRVSSLLEVGTGFHPELTGRENVFLNGAILGMSRTEIKNKFDEIVDFSGVEKFLDTPVKRYSTGMQLRLAFAVAAHLEPEILIVDEVLAVGDAEFQQKCLGKMNEVSKGEGRTVLFISHNLEAVQNICTTGLLLNNGQLVSSGSMKSIVREYLSGFSVHHAEREWREDEAPGNNNAKLLAAKVYDTVTGNKMDFNPANGFVLELVIDNLVQEKTQLDITYHLADENGILVTVSSSAFLPGKKYYTAGKINVKTSFPGSVLNEGTYTFSRILLVMNREEVLTEWNDVISFKLLPAPPVAGVWQNEREGLLKLNNLRWEITMQDVH